ncbi:DUF4255 domain-containing protein [Aliikangiella maris]|uniref:DUF4255 domain-containing protein n=2 Tax=Aliikangiella maris TaxID=3162458 RepID=A0ABV3ML43_9GAMM
MANLFGIHSVGDSLVQFLRDTYPEPLRSEHVCQFRLLSSGELDAIDEIPTTLSVYLYRIAIDEHTRNKPRLNRPNEVPLPLSVSLYYLITIWSDSALTEQTIAAWAMSKLNQFPILDQSTLSSSGGWEPQDQIHLVPIDLTNEDMMRIWDAVTPGYRLSIPYVARVVRINPDEGQESSPVVASQFRYGVIEDEL